ncbi:MAG: GAF domain-containing protein [Acidobacteria bacterium]|nr:GAF domain-containing protein [Acidobacteriota bacterium]
MTTEPPQIALEGLLSQQEALRQVIEEISSELELQPLLTSIVRRACELLLAGDGTIGLYDPERNVIRTEAVYRMPPEELGSEMGPGVGLAGMVLLERRPVVLDRYGDVPQALLPELSENAVLGVPIVWGQKLIGFFGIGASPPRRFGRRDVEILSLFARHAAIAIENAQRYRREKERAERLGLLARVARILSAGVDLDELLENAADGIHRLLGYANVAIPLLDREQPDILVLRAVGGSYRKILAGEYRQSVSQGLMGAAVRERRTVRVNDVEQDPRYVRTPGSQGIRAELAVPILLAGEVLGVLNVESPTRLTLEDASSLEIIADHLAVAIQNARLFERARRGAVLEERQRLARDLHDSVTQMLFSATLIAQAVPQAYRRDPEEGERRLARLLELNRAALGEMRALLRELRPPEEGMQLVSGEFPLPTVFKVRRDGLVPVLEEVLRESERDGLEVRKAWGGYRRQSPDLEETLFRVIQEGLHNVSKHAQAAAVEVGLNCRGGWVHLKLSDDGAGFDAREAMRRPPSDSGMGVVSMRERIRALGGNFRLESAPGLGTRIEIELREAKDPRGEDQDHE